MPLTAEDIQALKLNQTGLPAGFQGDRLDAFRLGLSTAIEIVKDKVSVDNPKDKEPK